MIIFRNILTFIIFYFLPAFCMAAAEITPTSFTDTPALEKVRNITNSSEGILVMSVIGTVYSGILYKGAANQETEAKANMVKLDKLIKTFKDSYVNICTGGRDNLSDPKCYCYLETGLQNPDRTNSQTCQALWATNSYKLSATAGDYTGVAHAVDPVGCVNLNGQFDATCTCTKLVDAKGANACMKTTSINIPSGLGSGFATSSGLQQVTSLANSAASGNPNLATLNGALLNTNAINSKKLTQEIFTKLAPNLPKDMASLTNVDSSNINRLAASVLGSKAMQTAANGSPSAVGLASSRETDTKTSDLLNQAAKNAGLAEISGGSGLANKKAPKEAFNFNLMNDPNGASASQTQNFPETAKNYNYKNSDISKKADISIFEIISNRYIQSGLKRLFDN